MRHRSEWFLSDPTGLVTVKCRPDRPASLAAQPPLASVSPGPSSLPSAHPPPLPTSQPPIPRSSVVVGGRLAVATSVPSSNQVCDIKTLTCISAGSPAATSKGTSCYSTQISSHLITGSTCFLSFRSVTAPWRLGWSPTPTEAVRQGQGAKISPAIVVEAKRQRKRGRGVRPGVLGRRDGRFRKQCWRWWRRWRQRLDGIDDRRGSPIFVSTQCIYSKRPKANGIGGWHPEVGRNFRSDDRDRECPSCHALPDGLPRHASQHASPPPKRSASNGLPDTRVRGRTDEVTTEDISTKEEEEEEETHRYTHP